MWGYTIPISSLCLDMKNYLGRRDPLIVCFAKCLKVSERVLRA